MVEEMEMGVAMADETNMRTDTRVGPQHAISLL